MVRQIRNRRTSIRNTSSGIEVKLARLGDEIRPYLLNNDSTVNDLLIKAGISTDEVRVKIDGQKITDFDTKLHNDSMVIIVPNVEGG